jgi:hypothetical protein
MTHTAPTRRRPWLRFTWHYVEMVIAMFVGMGVLGGLLAVVGLDFTYERDPEVAYLLMAFNMSVGMALWMRFRGHRWLPTLEMCAAMFAPALPLFPLLWLDAIDGEALMALSHLAMFPLMLAAMLLRRQEYLGHAH